jgi:hypothetical protein
MVSHKGTVSNFIIEFQGDNDKISESLSTHYSTIRIINSINSIWPIFQLYFVCDNQLFIEQDVYGSTDITLKIWYTGSDGEKRGSPVEYKLIILESKIDLPPKDQKTGTIGNQSEQQKIHVVVTCLAKPAYEAMTQFVNKLWEDSDGMTGTSKTPLDCVKEILKDNKITYRIFEDGKNEDTIQQMIIPPMTVRSAVDYINQNYGIFSGPLFRYANYSGQFLLWDLSKMYSNYKNQPWVKMHKASSNFDDAQQFHEINKLTMNQSDEFVTNDSTETIHHSNANVIRYGFDNIYIFHPHEDLVSFQKRNLDDIILKFGMWHNSDNMKYHPDLKNRKMYFIDMVGFETGSGYEGKYNDHILTQDMATSFQNTASIRMKLYKNVKFHMIQKIGEVLFLEPYSDHEKYKGSSYRGAYLVSESEIVFTREHDTVNCIATLTAYRTAQSMD